MARDRWKKEARRMATKRWEKPQRRSIRCQNRTRQAHGIYEPYPRNGFHWCRFA